MSEEENIETKNAQILRHKKNARIILIIGITLIITSPLILTQKAIWSFFDFSQTGQIGDTIGGITSPIVNLIAAVLVYLSFQQQILANEIQISLITQEKDKDRSRVDKELLLLFYNEIKESIDKLEYESVSKTALQRGRHGSRTKAIESYILDCKTYKESIRSMTDFDLRISTILNEIIEYIETCRKSKRLSLREIKFFIKRVHVIYFYYLQLPLNGFEEFESGLEEEEKISTLTKKIHTLLEKSILSN